MKGFPIFFFVSLASAAVFSDSILGNLIQYLFITAEDVDMRNFDFFGNELPRPDLSLEKRDAVCLRTGNDSELFRRFAGLLLRGASDENDAVVKWDFWRVDQLKAYYYEKDKESQNGLSSVDDIALDDKMRANFPKMKLEAKEKTELAEGFVVDLVLTLIPGLRGSRIEYAEDVAGVLLLLFLTRVEDFEGYFQEFEEFYGLMRSFTSGYHFELPTMTRGRQTDSPGLIEELLHVAVQLDLPYTLELFYAIDLVDFGDESVFKHVLKTARCPVVINRFFDFVPWNSDLDGVPKIHYIYEHHRLFLGMLFEYEPLRVDWRAVDVSGRTLLGKLLTSSRALYDDTDNLSTRSILKNFLSHANVRESAGTFITANRDILMKCYDNEYDGLRLLSEYCDNTQSAGLVIEDYLRRILEKWKESGEITSPVKVFKFLVKRTTVEDSREITPILSDAFEFFRNRHSTCCPCSPRGSVSRSISGNFFKSFLFVDNSSDSEQKSPPISPRSNSNVEMMRFVAQEARRITANENPIVMEMIQMWENVIADFGF